MAENEQPRADELDDPVPAPADSDTAVDRAATERALARDVAALVATVDQMSAELESLNLVVLMTAFAFGALAGIVYLQGHQLKELHGALGG